MKFGKTGWFLISFLIGYMILWIVLIPVYEICGMSQPPVCKLSIDLIRLVVLIVIGVMGFSTYIFFKKKN